MSAVVRQVLEVSGATAGAFSSILFAQTHRFAFTDDGGRLVTEQVRLEPEGMRVSRVRSTGHTIRLSEDRDATFLFPKEGRLALRVAGRDTRVDAGDAVLVRPATRLTGVSRLGAATFAGHVLMLPQAELDQLARAAGLRAAPGGDVTPVTGPAGRRLTAYVDFLLTDLDRPDSALPSPRALAGMAALMRDLLFEWVVALTDADLTPVAPPSIIDHARVRRAEEILRARFTEAIAVGDVAREIGISLRSLQMAFQGVHGEGPRARLMRIRLEAARARLLAGGPDELVTTIALDCGFTHLSRFAGAYRQAYGEHPRETLARRAPTPLRRRT